MPDPSSVPGSGDAEPHRPEEQLGSAREELAAILDGAADAIISVDHEQRIRRFNAGAERMFGYAAAEVIGAPLTLLIPERLRQAHERQVAAFGTGSVSSRRMGERSEVVGLRRDGSEFPAEASIARARLSLGVIYTAIVRDVSDRRQLERALEQRVAERTARLVGVLDAVPDGLVEVDPQHRVTSCNAAVARLFGYATSRLAGRDFSMLFASADEARRVRERWPDWEREGAREPIMAQCRREDGSVFTGLVVGNAIRDAEGRLMSWVVLIRDVTDELSRQRALQQAQKMEAVGQLTGGVAHDFNNLLTIISGNLELLDMRLEDATDRDLVRRADEAARMGARLTSRLLMFSRRRKLQPTVINLNDTALGMMELLRRTLGETINVGSSLASDLWNVRVDASEIENAILNLAINARDAMPSGGRILIETNNVVLGPDDVARLTDVAPGAYVKLSFGDTGLGMKAEVAARAFEPFFTTKEPGRGTGLGLSTIYGFIRQSGGHASIYSEPDRGTTVNLYLPRDAGAGPREAARERGPAAEPARSGTILVVEDNTQVRELAVRRLEALGYRTLTAESGAAAIAMLVQGASADLVFSDVVMPGGASGLDVLRWVRTHRPGVKVLLTSGFAAELAAPGVSESDQVALLRKPYTLEELSRAIRTALEA